MELFSGISNPFPRQISCWNRTLHSKDFQTHYFFCYSNHPCLHHSAFCYHGCRTIFAKKEFIALYEHCLFSAGNNALCRCINSQNNEIYFAAQHMIQYPDLSAFHFSIACVLCQIQHHFIYGNDYTEILIIYYRYGTFSTFLNTA